MSSNRTDVKISVFTFTMFGLYEGADVDMLKETKKSGCDDLNNRMHLEQQRLDRQRLEKQQFMQQKFALYESMEEEWHLEECAIKTLATMKK